MKILLLAPQPFFQNRGTPIAVRELIQACGAEGHEIDLVAYHVGEDVVMSNCRIHRTVRIPGIRDVPPGFSLRKVVCDLCMVFTAFRLLCRNRYDLVHAVEEAAFMGILFKVIFRVPYVYDIDSSLVEQLTERYRLPGLVQRALRVLEKLAVSQSVGVIAVCRSLEDMALRYDPGKLIVRLEDKSLLGDSIPGGECLARELGLSGPVAMYVGNLQPYQGIDLLLASHQVALRDLPNAELVIIGGSTLEIERYRARAEGMGILQRTHFAGPRPMTQLGHYLEQADVVVSPRIEGTNTPMKIYSYLDCGRPLLATRLATHTQVLDDDVAYLANPTAEEMAAGLVTLLGDPSLRAKLAARAKERVEEHYSSAAFERKLSRFVSQVQSVLDKGRPGALRTGEKMPA